MRENINDILAFTAVATDRSFTRAAARLGVSQSSLSRTIRRLEEQLGVRLLTRTTRSVSLTDPGQRLMNRVAPKLDEIAEELSAIGEYRDRPVGTVRITCSERAAETVLLPKLTKGLLNYPEIRLELAIDNGFTDIAAEGFDAGVRLGESLEQDMIAVRIGPDSRLIAVGAPAYFARHPAPLTPRDLVEHNCINLRLATQGNLYSWEFEKNGHPLRVRVDGQMTFNTIGPMITAALAGCGIALVPEDIVAHHVADGTLAPVLDDWCQPFSGFHLYYPSRRQHTAAFQIVIDLLRK